MRVRGLAGALLALASVSCGPARSGEEAGGAPSSTGEASPSPDDVVLAELRRFEGERRAGVDFGALPPSDARLGADPYALARAPGGRFVGLLRGADAVVLLDADLREVARVSGVRSPSGLAVEGERVFVVGEGAREVRLFSVSGDRLSATGAVSVPGAALRDVAVAGGVVYTIDEDSGLVYTLTPAAREPAGYAVTSAPVCAGPFRTIRTASALVTACLYDHAIVVRRAGAGGRLEGPEVKLTNDGPFWGIAAMEERGELLIASGGAEDLPLDRTHGSFENIDSFVYVHRVRFTGAQEPQVTRLAAVNVAAHGVVTPKALEITRDGDALRIVTTGYGGEAMATIRLRDGADPEVTARPLPPGTSALTRGDAGLVLANPLLDAWVVEGATGFELRKVSAPGDEQRSAQSRLGEALIFTTLMAPWNRSDGPLSRFTCETCHFEGYADGRTHATGRGDIVATTKPLLGLWNNRPHFSRALDPDLSAVAHAEFRVAGARSDHDPVFALRTAERPWLAGLGALPAISPPSISGARSWRSSSTSPTAALPSPRVAPPSPPRSAAAPSSSASAASPATRRASRATTPPPASPSRPGRPASSRSRRPSCGARRNTPPPASSRGSTPKARASPRSAGSTRSAPISRPASPRPSTTCLPVSGSGTARSSTTRPRPIETSARSIPSSRWPSWPFCVFCDPRGAHADPGARFGGGRNERTR
ncbi:MAG: hypothetical protein R3B70_24360 [Polyangiaceae bacterium]